MTGAVLRAPREDRQALIEPPLATVGQVLAASRVGISPVKQELLRLAREYTSQYRDAPQVAENETAAPVILAGHQPQLFHAGVWFKNFVLSELAKRHAATALNLIIDNDAAGTTAVRVPSGTLADPRVVSVPYDSPQREVPFEERTILDQACFESFGQRAAEAIVELIPAPLVREWWKGVQEAGRRTGNLGRAVAEGRHLLEQAWGLNTLEVPLSRVCETDSFRSFALQILTDLARFHAVHNSSLAEYRRINKVRSRTHPVSELATDGELFEAPFWLWTNESPVRRRLFARRRANHLELTDRDHLRFELSSDANRLAELSQRGVKLRPRALITTAYARVFLSDVFIHGIGGAKYDQLTDAILSRFFQLKPPPFTVATATLRLPLGLASLAPVSTADHVQTLRELRFHPERFVDHSAEQIWKLVAEKQRWIANDAVAEARAARHKGIESVNLALQPAVDELRARVQAEQREFRARRRVHDVLGSREFACCLFPAEYLRETLTRLAAFSPRLNGPEEGKPPLDLD